MALSVYRSGGGKGVHQKKAAELEAVSLMPGIPLQTESFVDQSLCIVSVSPDRQPRLLVTETLVIGLEGDVIGVGDVEALSRQWKTHGLDLPGRLNGNFNVVVYERNTGNLVVFNCKSSLYNFYYSVTEEESICSSNLRAIARTKTGDLRIDEDSAFRLLQFSYIFGDRTLLEGVRRLGPATVATFDGGTPDLSTYWEPVFGDWVKGGLNEVTAQFNEKLVEAARARWEHFQKITLFVSGGLDSRLIAAATERAGIRDAEAITYGMLGSKDLEYGPLCCEKLGFCNTQWTSVPGNFRFSDHLSLVVWLTEAQCTIKSLGSFKYHGKFMEHGIRHFSHGSTFGLLSSGFLPPYAFAPRSRDWKVERTLEKLTARNHARNRRVLRGDFFDGAQESLERDFVESFASVAGGSFADVFLSWFFVNREAKLSFNAIKAHDYFFNSIHFFLDRDLLDFYFRVPVRHRLEQSYQRASCLTLNPKIRDVPHQLTGRVVRTSLAVNMAERVAGKVLKNTPLRYRSKHKDPRVDVAKDDGLRAYILDRLDANGASVVSGMVNREGLESAMAEHYNGRSDFTETILTVAALLKFEEMFIQGRCSEFPPDAQRLLDTVDFRLSRT